MVSCVQGFLCIHHSNTLSQASVWSIVSSFIELAQQILRSPLVFSLFLAKVVAAFSFVSPLSFMKDRWRRGFGLCHRVWWTLRLLSGGFTAALFLVMKASGGWRTIIVLSALISSVVVPEFRTPRLLEVGPPAAASCSQIPYAIVLASSSYVKTFKRFAFFFWSFGPMESILPPWFSDSIGSKVSLATGSPFGSNQCRFAFGTVCRLVFCASELLSVAFRPVSFVFFFFLLLFARALFLEEPSDSFGSTGYLSNEVSLWDEFRSGSD